MALTKRDVKKLWAESGNQCAFPGCDQQLVNFEYDSIIGEMSHIRARKPDGPRYDEEMDEEERESYSNRILLCGTHHNLVDDAPDEFPPRLLERWKQEHREQSPDAPELSEELLDRLIQESNPSYLLVHAEQSDIACLREVLGWEPREEYPDKEERGQYPIVFTLDDLKQLHTRLEVPYKSKINGEPMYKQSSEWTEDELVQVSASAARITHLAIQYFQVEGERRKSSIYDDL